MSDSMIGQYHQCRCKYVEPKVWSEISTIHNMIIIKYSSGSDVTWYNSKYKRQHGGKFMYCCSVIVELG